MNWRRYILTICTLVLLVACSSDSEEPRADHPERQRVWLQLSFPAVEGETTRAPGDPGTTETLAPPRYAWIYFVRNSDSKVVDVHYDKEGVQTPLPRKVELSTFFGTHTNETYAGSLSTTGDEVYRFPLKGVEVEGNGRFYVVAANEQLKHGGTNLEDISVTTETDVLNLQFDLYSDDMKDDLKNIYSTPYNYQTGSPAAYYGSIVGENNVLDLMLYHVAARVDLKWNVAPALQATRWVKTLQVEGLKTNGCYIFRPMENTALGTSPWDQGLKTVEEVGAQWYGRVSFYTIPYTTSDHFDLDLRLYNGAAENVTTVQFNMTEAPTVFVPWIRLNLTYDEESDFTQSTLALDEQ